MWPQKPYIDHFSIEKKPCKGFLTTRLKFYFLKVAMKIFNFYLTEKPYLKGYTDRLVEVYFYVHCPNFSRSSLFLPSAGQSYHYKTCILFENFNLLYDFFIYRIILCFVLISSLL